MAEVSEYDKYNNPELASTGPGKPKKEEPIKINKYEALRQSGVETSVIGRNQADVNTTDDGPAAVVAGENVNESRAYNQSGTENMFSSLAKGTGLFISTAGSTFTTLPEGIIRASIAGFDDSYTKQQAFSKLYDNSSATFWKNFNETAEKAFPVYASEAYQKADLLSAETLTSSNFWGETILKNAGFTLGAIVGGGVVSKGLSKTFQAVGKIAGTAKALENASMVAELVKGGATQAEALRKVAATIPYAASKAQQLATGMIVASGEASMEAKQTHDELGEKLISQYKAAHNGEAPVGEDLNKIKQYQASAGNLNMAFNMAVLTASDLFQFNKLWYRGFKEEVSKAGQIATKEGIHNAVEQSFKKKLAKGALSYGANTLSETAEEGSQTLSGAGLADYYNRKYDKKGIMSAQDSVESLLAGMQETFGTRGGLESMLAGAITGFGSHAVTSRLAKLGNNSPSEFERATLTAAVLNNAGAKAKPYLDSIIRQHSINTAKEKNAQSPNPSRKLHEDLNAEEFRAFVQPYIQTGNFDALEDKLKQEYAKDEERFKEDNGENATRKTGKEFVGKLMQEAKALKKTWESIEDTLPKASNSIKERMFSILADIENRNDRKTSLSNEVFAATGVPYTGQTKKEYLAQVKEAQKMQGKTNPVIVNTANDVVDIADDLNKKNEEVEALQDPVVQVKVEAEDNAKEESIASADVDAEKQKAIDEDIVKEKGPYEDSTKNKEYNALTKAIDETIEGDKKNGISTKETIDVLKSTHKTLQPYQNKERQYILDKIKELDNPPKRQSRIGNFPTKIQEIYTDFLNTIKRIPDVTNEEAVQQLSKMLTNKLPDDNTVAIVTLLEDIKDGVVDVTQEEAPQATQIPEPVVEPIKEEIVQPESSKSIEQSDFYTYYKDGYQNLLNSPENEGTTPDEKKSVALKTLKELVKDAEEGEDRQALEAFIKAVESDNLVPITEKVAEPAKGEVKVEEPSNKVTDIVNKLKAFVDKLPSYDATLKQFALDTISGNNSEFYYERLSKEGWSGNALDKKLPEATYNVLSTIIELHDALESATPAKVEEPKKPAIDPVIEAEDDNTGISDEVQDTYSEVTDMSATTMRSTGSHADALKEGINSVLRYQNFISNPSTSTNGLEYMVINTSNPLYKQLLNKKQETFDIPKDGLLAVLVKQGTDEIVIADASGAIVDSVKSSDLSYDVDALDQGPLVTTLVKNPLQKESGEYTVSFNNFAKSKGFESGTKEEALDINTPLGKLWDAHVKELEKTRQLMVDGKITRLTIGKTSRGVFANTGKNKVSTPVHDFFAQFGVGITDKEIKFIIPQSQGATSKSGTTILGKADGVDNDTTVIKGKVYAVFNGEVYPLNARNLNPVEVENVIKMFQEISNRPKDAAYLRKQIKQLVYLSPKDITDIQNGYLFGKPLTSAILAEYLGTKFRQVDKTLLNKDQDQTLDGYEITSIKNGKVNTTTKKTTYRDFIFNGADPVLTINLRPHPTTHAMKDDGKGNMVPKMLPNYLNGYLEYSPKMDLEKPADKKQLANDIVDKLLAGSELDSLLSKKYPFIKTLVAKYNIKLEIKDNAFESIGDHFYTKGQYRPSDNTIVMDYSTFDEDTFAHEVIHAILYTATGTKNRDEFRNTKLSKELTKFYESVREIYNSTTSESDLTAEDIDIEDILDSIALGLESQEIVTYALTNPIFAKWLSSHKTDESLSMPKWDSLWSWFVDILTNNTFRRTKLTELSALLDSNLEILLDRTTILKQGEVQAAVNSLFDITKSEQELSRPEEQTPAKIVEESIQEPAKVLTLAQRLAALGTVEEEEDNSPLPGMGRSTILKSSDKVENIPALQKWFADRFNGESIEVVNSLINGNLFGEYTAAATRVFNGAEEGTGYHEAFHKVTQEYLTKKQLQSLYVAVRKNVNNKFTDLQAEEWLAEEFRKFMLNGQKAIKNMPYTNNVFRKLYNWIKSLLTGKTTPQQVFDKLASKKGYTGAKKFNVRQFTKLARPIEGTTHAQTRDIVESVNAHFFRRMFAANLTPDQVLGEKSTEVIPVIYKRVFESIKTAYSKVLQGAAAGIISEEEFNAINEHYVLMLNIGEDGKPTSLNTKVIEAHKKHLKSLGIYLGESVGIEEEVDDANLSNDNVQGKNKAEWQNANEENTIHSAPNSIKLLIMSLPEIDVDGNPVANNIGGPKLNDYAQTMKLLYSNLNGLSTYDEMWNKMQELAPRFPVFRELMNRIGESSSTKGYAQQMLENDFRQAFHKFESRGTITLINEETGQVYQVDANANKLRDKIQEKWTSNLRVVAGELNSFIVKDADGLLRLDETFTDGFKALLKAKNTKLALHYIGIDFTDLTREEVEGLYNDPKWTFRNDIDFIYSGLNKMLENDQVVTDLFKADIGTNLNNLISIEQELSKETVELSYISAEGKRIYAVSLNNYYSLVVNAVNNAKTLQELFDRYPHLDNPMTKNGLWLKNMFDAKGNKRAGQVMYMNTVSGIKLQNDADSGKAATKMEPSDKIVQEFTDLLTKGTSSLRRAGDKSSEYAPGITSYNGGDKLAVTMQDIQSQGFKHEKVKEIFLGYLKDELNRIRAFNNGVGKNIEIYNKNAGNFTLFASILTSETLSDLEAYKTNEEELPANLEAKIAKDVQTYLEQYTQRNKKYFQDRKVGLENKKDGITSYTGMSPELTGATKNEDGSYTSSNEKGLDNALRAFTVNHLINMVEQGKLMIGDDAFYKDIFKRISAGTGCLGLGTKIIMYDGSIKNVEDIVVGDQLMSPDGSPRNVLSLARGIEQMYLVHQKKGMTYRVNESHIISLKKRKSTASYTNTKGVKSTYTYNQDEKIVNLKVTDILDKGSNFDNEYKGWKPNIIFNFNRNITEEVTIDPYYFGLWLGDGCQVAPHHITNIDEEVIDFLKQYAQDLGLQLTTSGIQHKITCGIDSNRWLKGNVLLNEGTRLKIQEKKTIYPQYLFGSEEVRLQVLAGLMDSDGTYRKKDKAFHIGQIRYELSKEIALLARSLGFVVTESVRPFGIDKRGIRHQESYVLSITGNNLDRIPTKISRKKAIAFTSPRNLYVTGISIEKDTIDNYYGFELDGDHLFLLEDFTVTHNTKKYAASSIMQDNWFNNFYKNVFGRVDGKKANGRVNVVIYGDVKANENNFEDYVQALVAKGVSEEAARKTMDTYNNMDEGDAQGWITLDEYREFMMRVGGAYWTEMHEKQFRYEVVLEKSDTGKQLTESEQAILDAGNPNFYFMPIKAQYFGPQVMDGLYAPAFHKYSLAPLYHSLVKGRNMEDLLASMRSKEIGYALFGSGSKVGTPLDSNGKLPSFYGENGVAGVDNAPIQEIYYENLGIQLDIAPKVKDKVIFGSQFRKLLFSNLFGNTTQEWSKKLGNEYNKLINNQVDNELKKLIKDLGIEQSKDGVFTFNGDYTKLAEQLRKSIDDGKTADNILDSLQVDENGQLKYPIDSLVNRDKVERMLFSIVNNKVIKQKTLGNALVQLASSGFEPKGKREVGSANYLKFYEGKKGSKTSAMEVEIPMNDTFRPLLDAYKGDLDALNKAMEEGLVDKRMLTMVGYRIPTQGLNSMDFMTIKRFMPESSGVAIILPTSVVAKSGGDYDIDKLNIFMPNLFYNTKTGKTVYQSDMVNSPKEATQNRILEIATEVLSHEDNFIDLIKPNTTDDLVDASWRIRYAESGSSMEEDKWIKAEKSKKVNPTTNFEFTHIMDQFTYFLGGKAALGIAATHNTHHVLSQIADVKINAEIPFKHNTKSSSVDNTKLPKITIQMQPDNVAKILAGTKVTTTRSASQAVQIGLKPGTMGVVTFEGKQFYVRYRGAQTIEQAGGKEAIIKSEDVKSEEDFKYQQTKDWINGKGELHVYDFKPVDFNTPQVDLSQQYTQGGQKISDLISQFINAYVDVAKDPFYKDLNAGTEVTAMWMYMLRAGMDVNTVAFFMSQPIIKEYVNARKFNSSVMVRSLDLTRYEHKIKPNQVNNIKYEITGLLEEIAKVENEAREAGLEPDEKFITAKKLEIKKKKRLLTSVYNAVENKYGIPKGKWTTQNFKAEDINDKLLGWIKEGNTIKQSEFSEEFRLAQSALLKYFVDIEEQSAELGALMAVTNSDTKTTRSFGSQFEEDRKREAVEKSTVIPQGTAQRIRDLTIVGSFDKGNTMTQMFKELSLYMSRPEIKEGLDNLIGQITKKDKYGNKQDFEKEYTKLQNDFVGYLTQKYGKTLEGQPLYSKIALLSGDNSLAKQLITFNREGLLSGNPFIKELVSLVNEREGGIDNIKMYSRRLTAFESNVISEGFRELINANDPRVQELGRNLAYLTILQSGLNNSPITFTELIPFEFYGDIVKAAITSALKEGVDMDNFAEKLANKQNSKLSYKLQDFGLDKAPTISDAEVETDKVAVTTPDSNIENGNEESNVQEKPNTDLFNGTTDEMFTSGRLTKITPENIEELDTNKLIELTNFKYDSSDEILDAETDNSKYGKAVAHYIEELGEIYIELAEWLRDNEPFSSKFMDIYLAADREEFGGFEIQEAAQILIDNNTSIKDTAQLELFRPTQIGETQANIRNLTTTVERLEEQGEQETICNTPKNK